MFLLDPKVHAAQISFFRLSLPDGMKNSVTQEELVVEPLFLPIQGSQFRCLKHVLQMLSGRLSERFSRHVPMGRDSREYSERIGGRMFLIGPVRALGFPWGRTGHLC